MSIELWEKAADTGTIDYEAIIRRLAEIYAQGSVAGWSDGPELTALARRRIARIIRGERAAVDWALHDRRTWAARPEAATASASGDPSPPIN